MVEIIWSFKAYEDYKGIVEFIAFGTLCLFNCKENLEGNKED